MFVALCFASDLPPIYICAAFSLLFIDIFYVKCSSRYCIIYENTWSFAANTLYIFYKSIKILFPILKRFTIVKLLFFSCFTFLLTFTLTFALTFYLYRSLIFPENKRIRLYLSFCFLFYIFIYILFDIGYFCNKIRRLFFALLQ